MVPFQINHRANVEVLYENEKLLRFELLSE